MAEEPPVPKFQRFERVLVVGEPYHFPGLRGRVGTVLWRDVDWPYQNPTDPHRWLYLVYFEPERWYRSVREGHLQSEGAFDSEAAHLGTWPEFSFDVIMEDNMTWVEGTYRLPGRFWEVMIFGKADTPELSHRLEEWRSGIKGTSFKVPDTEQLNRDYVRWALTHAFGYTEWFEVAGPDSMVLR